MDDVGDPVEPDTVPRLRRHAVGQVAERDARFRVCPGVRRARAAVPERRRRGDSSQSADRGRHTSKVRAKTPVHRHPHTLIDPVTGVVASGELDYARANADNSLFAGQSAFGEQRLVEGRQANGAARHARVLSGVRFGTPFSSGA